MKRLNILDVDTRWGFRSFELWNGDVTKFDFAIDLLLISSFGTDFFPLEGTVIGALSEIGISVEQLRTAPEVDLI